ncbi:class II aldolase/adducin family protein [Calothrix sp. 336/3]|uniref:class II aldolase/adducin family protein n=1 Tax=Calothrix sp. 336/3 TaxID=1337936 RepID=UPI0004E3F720|nr:class II aldolase/adducin family protein [Calothrix sp. 336/3]AKG21417.1 hypothetical protein IJ00_09020 [Calothrix sp. 336/3]
MKYFDCHEQEIDYRVKLVDIARDFYRRGWMPRTTGNLSVWFPDSSFAIAKNNSYKSLLMPNARKFLMLSN